MKVLRKVWRDIFGSDNGFGYLVDQYSQPWRHFHTLDHIHYVLGILDTCIVSGDSYDLDIVTVALMLHDVVYDPARSDNEERSAEYAASVLKMHGTDPLSIDEVKRLIMVTNNHQPEDWDMTGKWVSDCDLAGLGGSWYTYSESSALIRLEYSMFDDEQWKQGRSKFINSMLERDKIFHLARQFEKSARENLQKELEYLER